jgi:hypothetical protein
MKYLVGVPMGVAAIVVAITTAVAQAHGALLAKAWLKPPYVYGYSAAALLVLASVALGIQTAREEENRAATDSRHKHIRVRLAELMNQHQEILAQLRAASNDSAYTELIKKADNWANDTASLLKQAGYPTDAEMLSQVGHAELSSEQLARFAHVPVWKRNVLARFSLYRQTLDQIISNRRL